MLADLHNTRIIKSTMRARTFFEHIPDVTPHLIAVSELDRDELRDTYLVEYGGRIDHAANTAHATLREGMPLSEGCTVGDLVQLGALDKELNAWGFRDETRTRVRRGMDLSIAALVRISEVNPDNLERKTKVDIGKTALGVTRAATIYSTYTSTLWTSGFHMISGVDEIKPQDKIAAFADDYTALLPYMDRKRAEYLRRYL